MMHLVSDISKLIGSMDSGDNFTTDIFERLHIRNVKETYWFTNKVNYIQQILKHTMTSVPVLTIWRRHCHILPSKAGTILTLRKFSTYYQLPINGEIRTEPIFYIFTIVRKSHFSALSHNRYIIWEKLISAACAEVLNSPHSEMHQ